MISLSYLDYLNSLEQKTDNEINDRVLLKINKDYS